MKKTNDTFYCYSYKMFLFLSSLDFKFKKKDINKNTNTTYWSINKSERLDKAIKLWNEIKHSI